MAASSRTPKPSTLSLIARNPWVPALRAMALNGWTAPATGMSGLHTLRSMPLWKHRAAWGLCAALALAGCGNDGSEGSAKQAAIHITTSAAYTDQGQYRAAIIEARNAIKQAPGDVAGPLQLARVYLALGNYRGAADILEQLPDNAPAEARIALAQAYVNLGKYRSASDILQAAELRAAVAESTAAQIAQAEALAGEEHYSQAESRLQDIIERQPDAEDAYVSLARVYFIQHQIEPARAILEQLLARNPQHSEALLLLALQARAENDLETADRRLSGALAGLPQTDIMTPLKVQVLSALADTLTQLGRPAEALVYTRLLAEANPGANESRKQFGEAVQLFQAGNIEEAEKILSKLNAENPDHAYSALLLGLVNFQQGDYRHAGELLSGNIDPETANPRLILATALSRLSTAPDEALALVEQALEYHPEDVGLNAFYGTALLRQPGDEQRGLDALNKAIELAPDQGRLRLPLASHYRQTGQLERARAEFIKAAELSPADPPVQSALVGFLTQQQQLDEARAAAERFVRAAPKLASSHLLAARVYTQSQQLDTARSHFGHASQIDPDNLLVHLGLGQVELMDNDPAAAEQHFQRAVELAPEDPRPYMGIVTALELQQRNADVQDALEALADQHATNGTALAVLAQYQLRNDNTQQALETIGRSEPGPGASAYVNNSAVAIHRSAAQQQLAEGDLRAARASATEALRIGPGNPQTLAELIGIELTAERYDEAERLLDELRMLPAGEPSATLLSARQAARQERPDEARQILEQRWQTQREPTVADNLYGLLIATGDTEAATGLLADWADLYPQDPRPLSHRAMAAQQQGRTGDAIDLYQQALELSPRAPLLLNNLAWLYFEADDERALDTASRAADAAPNNAAILDTYGWILAQRGQAREGVEVLERAARLAPEHPEIRQHLEQARAML